MTTLQSTIIILIIYFTRLIPYASSYTSQHWTFRLPSISHHDFSAGISPQLQSSQHGNRYLEAFATLNNLFSKVTFVLPDSTISQSGLDLTVTDLTCAELYLQDIQVENSFLSNTTQRITTNIEGIGITCNFRWSYKWTIFTGSGSGKAVLDSTSRASVNLDFTSIDYNHHPPTNVAINDCNSDVQIDDLQFDGDGLGVIASIISLFERLLIDRIEGEVNTMVCTQLGGTGDGALDGILLDLSNKIGGYLEEDPLLLENSIIVSQEGSKGPLYLNFLELENYAGDWINTALEKLDTFIAGSGDSGELSINSLIREQFLDSDGQFALDPADFLKSSVMFDLKDMLTETTMSIESIVVRGLDSFSALDLMNASGNYTLRNTIKLDKLSFELNMKALMQASTQSNAVIYAPDSPPVEESFTITLSLNEIVVDFSLLVLLNTETLGNLELGSFLHTNNIMNCIISSADQVTFTELSLSVSDIVPPVLTGFIDTGIDAVMSNGADALFDMYEKVLIKAMPNFFQTFVREKLNDYVKNSLRLFEGCDNDVATTNGHIDFRDLMLTQELALDRGGSGNSPYGNVVPWLTELAQEYLFSADENGLLAINELFIRPSTKSQSGTEGLFKFNNTLIDLNKTYVERNIWRAFAENLRLSVSNLRLSGLDTIREPVQILEPINSSGYILDNKISIGNENKTIDATMQFLIELGGPNSPLASKNILDLHVSIPSIELFADFFARIDESRFASLPLKHVLNPDCWLSLISSSQKTPAEFEKPILPISGMAIHNFDLMLGGIVAKASCLSCSNEALDDFNDIMAFLDKNEFISNAQSRGLAVVSDIIKGKWMQGILDGQIDAASRRCPIDPKFGNSSSDLVRSPFRANRQLVDGVLYGAMTLVQVIAVVLVQRQNNLKLPPVANIEFVDVPKSAKLIDFTNLTSVAGWTDVIFKESQSYLGSTHVDDVGNSALGIVNIFKSFVLDDEGLLTIPIIDEGFKAGGVTLSLYNVTLQGMDSFSRFNVFNVTGPHTFGNNMKLEKLGVSVEMGLSVEEGETVNELEKITASLVFRDVDIDFSFLLAVDQNQLGNLQLGSIMNTHHIFLCILSTIHKVGLPHFVMHIGDIEDFSMSGFMTDSTESSTKQFTEAVFKEYKETVLDAIPAFSSTVVRTLIHNIFNVLVEMGKKGSCPTPIAHSPNEIVDFRDLLLSSARSIELLGSGDSRYGDLFRILFSYIEGSMESTNRKGLSMMNDVLISKFTQNGDLYWDGEIFQRDMKIALNGLNAAMSISIKDLRLSNLDTLAAPVRLLQPIRGESNVLNNSASVGGGPDPLRVSFTLVVNGEGDRVKVNDELELGLRLSTAMVLFELLAEIQETELIQFPLRDLTNINCWLSTVVAPVLDRYGMRVGDRTVAVQQLLIEVAEAELDMNCISCSSPLLLDISSYFGSVEGVDDTTKVANMMLNYISTTLQGEFVQNIIDKHLNEAAMKCPHSSAYVQNFNAIKYDDIEDQTNGGSSYGFLIAIIAVIAVMLVLSSIMVLATKYITRRRFDRWIKQLNRSQVLQLIKDEEYETLRQRDIDLRMKALVFSRDNVPFILRIGIPIVIIGNIALFLSGHLSLGGTVNISGSFAGQLFDVQGFFEFSMAKSTLDMWEAGAHSLAILIVLFSGVWPYTKQIMILCLWFLPPNRVSSKRRGNILRWLDILGKWSIVDIFVLLMSLASFRITIESPSNLKFLPEGLFEINMMVVPLWGLYANLLAQILSQVSSHVIIHYHSKTVNSANSCQEVEWNVIRDSTPDNPQTLRRHCFKLDYEATEKYAVVRKWVSSILALLFISFFTLVICGVAIPSFSIEIVGLLGIAVEAMNEFKEAIVYYSVFDLAKMIMDEARYLDTASNYLGLGTLSSLLVITVFLVPIIQGATLIIQWCVPMKKIQRKRILVVNEILSAWQYMEVFVFSVVIAAWQLGGVSEYMINAYCDSLDTLFTTLSFYGILSESDAQCFRVNASVEKASWLIIAASIILSYVNHFITSASSQMEMDENRPTDRTLLTDRWNLGKLSPSSTVSASMEDCDEGSTSTNDLSISPIPPRFSDYYSCAITKISVTDHPEPMLPNVPTEIESATAFWDIPVDYSDAASR